MTGGLSGYHFSIDDVFNSLIEASDQHIPLFDHPFFNFVKGLHDQFDAAIDCYVFYRGEINGKVRTLQEVSSHIKQTIMANPWLKLGPHADDYQSPPYAEKPANVIDTFDKIYSEINRFAGGKNNSRLIRLHYFSELYELADYFKERKVRALFTTDKDIFSYRMPRKIEDSLDDQGVVNYRGMTFIRTHFRVEYFINDYPTVHERNNQLKRLFEKYQFVIFFTHECDISNPKVRQAITSSINFCTKLGLHSI